MTNFWINPREPGGSNGPKFNKSNSADLTDAVIALLAVSAGVSLVCGMIFVAALVHAVVIAALWKWYVVVHFGLAPLPLAVAFGISLLFSYLGPTVYQKDERKPFEKLLSVVVRPLAVLTFGYIGTWFM